jgi:alkylation response protein AidB-like acyl-CoA dehydrogenase
MKTLNMTRPGVAAIGLGMATAALDFTGDQLREAGVEIVYGGSARRRSATAARSSTRGPIN